MIQEHGYFYKLGLVFHFYIKHSDTEEISSRLTFGFLSEGSWPCPELKMETPPAVWWWSVAMVTDCWRADGVRLSADLRVFWVWFMSCCCWRKPNGKHHLCFKAMDSVLMDSHHHSSFSHFWSPKNSHHSEKYVLGFSYMHVLLSVYPSSSCTVTPRLWHWCVTRHWNEKGLCVVFNPTEY